MLFYYGDSLDFDYCANNTAIIQRMMHCDEYHRIFQIFILLLSLFLSFFFFLCFSGLEEYLREFQYISYQ